MGTQESVKETDNISIELLQRGDALPAGVYSSITMFAATTAELIVLVVS